MKSATRVMTGLAILTGVFIFSSAPSPANAQEAANLPYMNPNLPAQERAIDLVHRMTLPEKASQLVNQARPIPRLKVPAYNFWSEALHGVISNGTTEFPEPIGLAATFDAPGVHAMGTDIGVEARVRHRVADRQGGNAADGLDFWAPNLNIFRDPRWGRGQETYGEDPYLTGRMGVAFVTGLQGDSLLIDRHHVLATAKHFAVHGQPEGGTNTAPGNYSERIIRENFLVPFQAAVQEGRVGSVMASYNEIDGVPSHINHWLLDRVLRQEWGFKGYITSDGDGLQMLYLTHHVAYNSTDAAKLGLEAGIDYDLSDGSVFRTLADQVKQGVVPVSEVDRATARILAAKFRLGLFDQPYVDPDYAEKITNGEEHQKLAAEAARKTLVLLKNDKNLLPLDLSKLKTIAVIGPNAADVHVGGYARDPVHGVSILDGIRNYVGKKANVVYAEGCKITTAPEGFRGWWANDVELVDPKTQTASIQAAVDAAKKADVAILVVGENESTNREAWGENHRGDRDSLDLLGAQNDLVKAVVETGKPVVVLLLNGRPLSINYIAEKVPAILEGFYLGEEGGTAAADVIFGDANPGGRLPITFPRTVGALPDFYNHKPTDNRSYAFSTRKPLFAFGYGLTYTTFKYDNLKVTPEKILPGATAKVSLDVTNIGQREGDEVPQLYVHPKVSSVTQPVQRLMGFERITLKPGEKKTVEFAVTPDDLAILDVDMHKVVEPGIYEMMVGPSSDTTTTVKLTVTGAKGETGAPPLPPPPAGSESGLVSDFDNGTSDAKFGSWMAGGDSMSGGKSTGSIKVVEPGADNTKGALEVSGELVNTTPFAWGGVIFWPAVTPMSPANLSARKSLSFWAKGDGQTYMLLMLTASRNGNDGQPPAMVPFSAGPEWKKITIPFTQFETDGSDISGLGFMHVKEAGKFKFEIDQVRFE